MIENQNRRGFLKSTGAGAAAMAAGTPMVAAAATREKPPIHQEYPVFPIADAARLQVGSATAFHYPDKDSPCLLIKAAGPVPGGVGPGHDIVAFSAMCTHMGCLVSYDAGTQTLKCPCHFSVFDPECSGQMVCGQATENLPQIALKVDERSGRISATGVNGQLYGRVGNLL